MGINCFETKTTVRVNENKKETGTTKNPTKEQTNVSSKKENKISLTKPKTKTYEIDLSPEEIQKIMEENGKKSDEINSLKQQLDMKQNECANLLNENNQLKFACCQYQLIIQNYINYLNQNSNNNNNNIRSWRIQINNIMDNNNFENNNFNNNLNNANNFNNNNFINNDNYNNNFINNNNFSNNNNNYNNNLFKNENNHNNNNFKKQCGFNSTVINIIFHFENGKKYQISTFNWCKLKDVYELLLIQNNENGHFSNIEKLGFFFGTHNVTNNFMNNDKVEVLKLKNGSQIDVILLKNNVY